MSETKRFIEYMPLSKILGAETNPKEHDAAVITQSVRRFGFGETPMVDDRTGKLVAGHGRIEVLRALKARGKKPPEGVQLGAGGEWLVPVQRGWRSRDDIEARAYVVTSNKSSEVGGWSADKLAAELAAIADDSVMALLGTGFDDVDLARMLEVDEPEPVVPPAEGGFRVLVMCATEAKQAELLMRLTQEGFECRSLIS